MTSSGIFSAAYLFSLVVAILSGIFAFPVVLPSAGLVIVWVLTLFGFVFYRRTHSLTDSPNLQQSHLTVTVMLAVQAIAVGVTTMVYLLNGQFYTSFLTFEVVCSAFLVIEWLDDEVQVHRVKSGVPRLDRQ